MTKFSTSVFIESPFRAPFWARFWGALWGWLSRSPRPSSPPSSATLDCDDEDLPDNVIWAVDFLGNLAETVVDGDAVAFNLTVQNSFGQFHRVTFIREPQAFDVEPLSVATMEHGRVLIQDAATRQGNAPPQNRSHAEQ